MKTKPDPEEFARQMLWALCGLRAESQVMLHMFARHIEPDIKKADAIYVEWAKSAGGIQRKLYEEARLSANIPPTPDQNQPPTERT